MIERGSRRGASMAVAVLALCSLGPRAASAQQWHELYGGGVAALRDGEAQKAVEDRAAQVVDGGSDATIDSAIERWFTPTTSVR